MDKFRRVERRREESAEDEVRVTNQGRVTTYVAYAARLFKDENRNTITFRASGLAIPIAISTIEILKRRVKGLHQQSNIGVTTLTDEYEPLEQGLTKRTFTRQVPYMLVILSKLECAVDKLAPGYQAPLDECFVKELKEFTSGERHTRSLGPRGRGRRGRGRGALRGSRQGNRRSFGGPQDRDPQSDVIPAVGRGGARRGGNGRTRGFGVERANQQPPAATTQGTVSAKQE